jgi:AraC-like DNA-binding protein
MQLGEMAFHLPGPLLIKNTLMKLKTKVEHCLSYSNIIRFQNALTVIKKADNKRSLLDIAFECGFYDHSHLANEIKRNTGLAPTQL